MAIRHLGEIRRRGDAQIVTNLGNPHVPTPFDQSNLQAQLSVPCQQPPIAFYPFSQAPPTLLRVSASQGTTMPIYHIAIPIKLYTTDADMPQLLLDHIGICP